MVHNLEKLESLPLWENMSWWRALTRIKSVTASLTSGSDWDLTNQCKNRFRNAKSKNAKAKHRKKFKRC